MTAIEAYNALSKIINDGHGNKKLVMMDYMQTEDYFKGKSKSAAKPLTTVEDIGVINDAHFGVAVEIKR